MASTEISIKQLPTITSIESGNFVIVQTENATTKLDFKDFVVGLENTTFANVISSSTAGFTGITANTTRSTNNATNIATNTANITTLNTDVDIVSANVLSLSSSVGGLDIDGSGGVTFTALTATSLSAGSLSAGALDVNGVKFKGYPSYNQVIFKTKTSVAGSGATAVDLNLATSMPLKSSDSKVRVSFSVPGTVVDAHNVAFGVQQGTTGGSGNWSDITDFFGNADGDAVIGTVIFETDSNQSNTASFTGIFTPASLGTNDVIYVRVVMRLETNNNFIQNAAGSAAGVTSKATGVSTLLIEEVFV